MSDLRQIKSIIKEYNGVVLVMHPDFFREEKDDTIAPRIPIKRDGADGHIDPVLFAKDYKPLWDDFTAYHERFCLEHGLDPQEYTKSLLLDGSTSRHLGFWRYCHEMVKSYKDSDDMLTFVAERELNRLNDERT